MLEGTIADIAPVATLLKEQLGHPIAGLGATYKLIRDHVMGLWRNEGVVSSHSGGILVTRGFAKDSFDVWIHVGTVVTREKAEEGKQRGS